MRQIKRIIIRIAIFVSFALACLLAGCQFSQFSQSVDLETNIDKVRTGCEIHADELMASYKQYDANRLHFGDGPTPTPDPISDTELTTMILLEKVWEHGCLTGRQDVAGTEQASLMALRDQLELFERHLERLDQTISGTPTPAPTPPPPTPTVVE